MVPEQMLPSACWNNLKPANGCARAYCLVAVDRCNTFATRSHLRREHCLVDALPDGPETESVNTRNSRSAVKVMNLIGLIVCLQFLLQNLRPALQRVDAWFKARVSTAEVIGKHASRAKSRTPVPCKHFIRRINQLCLEASWS